jgi:hypothetical protein
MCGGADMSDKNIDLSDKNHGDAVVSNDSLHFPRSGIYAILSMIDYLQPQLAHFNSAAGHLLQMCKAELLRKLAMEATTSALGNGPAQINADFASLSQAYSSDAARKITMAKTARDNTLSIARHINQARIDIAANRVKERISFVKELGRGAQISSQQELSGHLTFEAADGRRHGGRGGC